MSFELSPGPSPMDRLETAIGRMVQKHGFARLDSAEALASLPAGLSALLLTDEPQRNLEILDACVILPEALKPLAAGVARLVAGAEVSQGLMKQYGVARAPAVVFLRDGQFVGVLNGIRNWDEYQAEVNRLLTGPAQPKPVGIPVVSA